MWFTWRACSSWRHAYSRPFAVSSINAIIIISFSLCFDSKRLVFLISFCPKKKTTVYWINFIRIDTTPSLPHLSIFHFQLKLLLSFALSLEFLHFFFLIHLALFILCCYFFFFFLSSSYFNPRHVLPSIRSTQSKFASKVFELQSRALRCSLQLLLIF